MVSSIIFFYFSRSSAGYLSVGSESGVVSLFNLNKIDHHLNNNDSNNNNFSNNLLDTSFTSYKSSTKQIKSIMNLTTTITSTGNENYIFFYLRFRVYVLLFTFCVYFLEILDL
jgi:hypothetical protein